MPSLEAKSDIESTGDNGKIDIKQQNKNFFNGEFSTNGIWNNDGTINYTIQSKLYWRTDFIKIPNKNIYFSSKQSNIFSSAKLLEFNANKKYITSNTIYQVNSNLNKVSLNESTRFIAIQWSLQSATEIENLFTDFQIESGSTATDYTLNQTNKFQMILNKPLRGIKTTDSTKANYIDENGNYWITDYVADDGIHRKIGEISFDGTENNWSDQWSQCDTDARKFFSLQITSIKNDTKNRQAICNLFKYTNLNIQSKTVDITAFHFNNGANFSDFIYFKIEKFLLPTPNLAGWKKLLVQLKENNTPLTVQYELGKETLEEFTEEERKSWNEFKKMKTFKSKNYINSTDEIQAGIEFTYKKDNRISTKKELEKCNERLANIEQLLSTTETSSLLLDNLEKDLEEEV